ncbi:glycosyltransferase family 4 protein [Micromonas pusilla CCMP1545]|uniref:Alpha-1,3/1,6-mannosyltransferase ALG2 n=1 Tax=Micromonas pusilla (strain CCMP1545) TaxID=564608 RepID=C1MK51_MICPC|nr:glycosyltransferase family 4 protein [Micromonas pusilla CCMP1545]EEH59306.1 glycosyltransferase family 4 protein [Micromonas pusilla CCMP1545]|eukprot:XP_003055930.1 glycosyltransferase family 4 protein [Micromonas pusilla CCMP1545]
MTRKKVAIIHPDLGIGGAERLIIDAVLELIALNYDVVLYTGYHSTHACFEETLFKGKREKWIRVRGSWIPRHLNGHFHVLFANLRCMWATAAMLISERGVDIVLLDQISSPALLLRMFSSTKIVFYCHYPDMLLAKHKSFAQGVYRSIFDGLERITTGMAHHIFVNSYYTADIFAKTFESGFARGRQPTVLYPAVSPKNVKLLPKSLLSCEFQHRGKNIKSYDYFLSINRFEYKKNLELALNAYAEFRTKLADPSVQVNRILFAGGYDSRLSENEECFFQLHRKACSLGISEEVVFLPSISTEEKNSLLLHCFCVIYTPKDEHFGIVPIEAMSVGKPVVACNSGGPVESCRDGVTGFTCPSEPEEFARAMNHLGDGHNKADRMGYLAQARIMNVFSRKSFGEELHSHLTYLSSTACFPAVFCYPGRFFLVCILLYFITWVIQRSTFIKIDSSKD